MYYDAINNNIYNTKKKKKLNHCKDCVVRINEITIFQTLRHRRSRAISHYCFALNKSCLTPGKQTMLESSNSPRPSTAAAADRAFRKHLSNALTI